MKPIDLLNHFGNQAAIARFFNVSPMSVSEWFKNDEIPMGRQYEAQVRTAGVLYVKPETKPRAA